MDLLESKIPPPVVALVVALVMQAVAVVTPTIPLPAAVATSTVWTLAGAGLAVELLAAVTMVGARTTVDPIHPERASSLVSGGVFRFTRNPIYLGDLLLLLAWAVHLASPVALLATPLFVLYIDWFQIVPEERVLSRLFGEAYGTYRARTRRWL